MEGQCGVEMGAVIPFPMPILELMGSPVTQIVAGKLSTGVVMGGDAWTFGSSSAGQLGLGTCVGAVVVPSRVSEGYLHYLTCKIFKGRLSGVSHIRAPHRQ